MRVLVEEEDDLAAWALTRVTVLQPLGAITKDVLAASATDLDGVFHIDPKISTNNERGGNRFEEAIPD
ncbi:hypothetical protein HU230_0014280 [Bradyrhizobium quebecense]|uniref:Uncharacterized protein n=1 Tax=Bradyrhizobium quebecense TaxID=2748629 RepID=A0A973WMH6_9BRAD|nr:hypothetical protein [Bradyrhizobium quebecense]UGA47139.1 hypothetical protein HU230_0014280 [Bradyrhizobium quebecense]